MKISGKILAIGLSALTVTAYASPPTKPVPGVPGVPGLEPSSYTAITGKRLHPDWLDTDLGFTPQDGGPAAPVLNQKTPHSNYIAQMDETGDSTWEDCKTVGGTEVGLLSIDVIPTADLLDIEFTTQAAINPGTVPGSTLFVCSVTQLGSTASCSATKDNPALVQRIRTSTTPGSARLGNLGFTGYHGYVKGLIPGQPATVKISGIALPAAVTTLGQFCYSNLIVRNGHLPPT